MRKKKPIRFPPCEKCGDNFYDQVDGVCVNCITRPLMSPQEKQKLDREVAEERFSPGVAN